MSKLMKKVNSCLLSTTLLATGIASSSMLLPMEHVNAIAQQSETITPKDVNLALNKQVIGWSGEYNNNSDKVWTHDKVTDGDVNTRWSPEHSPSWVVIDLGSKQTFNKVELVWENNDAYVTSYEVFVSDEVNITNNTTDNTNTWKSVLKVTNNDNRYSSHILSTAVSGRYVKVKANTVVGTSNASCNEIRIFNDSNATSNIQSKTEPALFTKYDVLKTNAKANSECNPENGNTDGPAAWAFAPKDPAGTNVEDTYIWHSDWEGYTNVNGQVSPTNPVYIRTGFNENVNLKKITYVGKPNSTHNLIKDYEVYYSTNAEVPNVTFTNGNQLDTSAGWTLAKSGSFQDVTGVQEIVFNQTITAKWIVIVAKSSNGQNGNYVCADAIRFYTDGVGEKVDYNVNRFRDWWMMEESSGTMKDQTNDRWKIQLKQANTNTWTDIDKVNGATWNGNAWILGNQGTIEKDGFRNGNVNGYDGESISWQAPTPGYYKFVQYGNAETYNFATGHSIKLVHDKNGSMVDLKTMGAKPNSFETNEVLFNANERFRIIVSGSSTTNYCDFGKGSQPKHAFWEVLDVTRDVARTQVGVANELLKATNTEAATTALTTAKTQLETAIATGTNADIVAKVEALEKSASQFRLIKYMETIKPYQWTTGTNGDVQQAITTAQQVLTNASTKQQLDEALRTLITTVNNATRLYNVDILVNTVKNDLMSFKQVYNKAGETSATISAPTVQNGKNFVGWFKKKGNEYLYRVTNANITNLDVVASNDVTYEAVYEQAPTVSTAAGIEMQNSFVSKNGAKYDAKFVGKYYNLPAGATNVEFGLKWGKNPENLTPVKFNGPANKYQQFSLTVRGLTQGQSVTGQVYLKYTVGSETVELVSEKVTLDI